jgi:3-oxoacyl-[acyl-carrier protein] reductase
MGVLSGKVALVTGASRGLGRAIAERLGQLGASVAVNYSSSEEAAQECVAVIEKTGARAVAIQADMADVDEIHALFASAKQALGDIDIAVANAGLEIVDVATVDFTEDQFDRAFAINTKGTFFTLQQAARTVADNGRIICVGSSSTEFATPGHALYGGSKVAPASSWRCWRRSSGPEGSPSTRSSRPPSLEQGSRRAACARRLRNSSSSSIR